MIVIGKKQVTENESQFCFEIRNPETNQTKTLYKNLKDALNDLEDKKKNGINGYIIQVYEKKNLSDFVSDEELYKSFIDKVASKKDGIDYSELYRLFNSHKAEFCEMYNRWKDEVLKDSFVKGRNMGKLVDKVPCLLKFD